MSAIRKLIDSANTSGAVLNDNYTTAAKMLARRRGATLEQLCETFDTDERGGRGVIDRLRAKGLDVVLIAPRTWALGRVARELANDNKPARSGSRRRA